MQSTSLQERVLRFLSSCESATAETLRRHAGVPQNRRSLFNALLLRMQQNGEIECKNGLYSLPRPVLFTGVLTGNERGFSFFTPDDTENNADKEIKNDGKAKDIFIPAKYLNGAMHKDRVIVRVLSRGARGESDTGEVVRIISRGFSEIVGAFYKDRRGGRLVPDDIKYFSEIYIPLSACANVKNGVKAVAKIVSYAPGRCPQGEISPGNAQRTANRLHCPSSRSLYAKERFMNLLTSFADFFAKGGPLMWPILLCSVLALC